MKMNMKHLYRLSFLLLLAACTGEEQQPPKAPAADNRTVVNITTRALNAGSSSTMQAGLFMVNYLNGNPDELLPTNNYVHNQQLTWTNGAWQTATPIYWSDMNTRADFYAYAPYVTNVSDARKMPFSLSLDQRTDAAFAKSDFLWGTVQGQSPTQSNFELNLAHQFSRITINVTADTGFTEDELLASDISVTIGGTLTAATIDLQTAAITLNSSSTADVCCHYDGNFSYTAVLLPQQVPFANLIQVEWQGNKYILQNSFVLEARKQYTLTVKLKKTKSGFDIGIAGWDILPDDFGGVIGGN